MAPPKHLKFKAAAVLTAGAPTSPLMAGALAAVYEKKRTYDWIFTSGSGSLVGLSLVAPKGKSPPDALRGLIDLTVADPVYKVAPMDHKVFFKAGPWSEMFRRLTPYLQIRGPQTSFGKTFNDFVSLFMSAAAPTNLTFLSKGLCNPNPWIDDFVDFEKLKAFKGGFTVNAYNITKAKMGYFEKNELTADHLRAATACPFIYPPFHLNGNDYYEGADVDPINLPVLRDLAEDNVKVAFGKNGKAPKAMPPRRRDQLEDDVLRFDMRAERLTVVVFDVLGSLKREALIRLPRNLLDAYAISLTTPLRSIVLANIDKFKVDAKTLKDPIHFEVVNFDIPKKFWPFVLDWTESNAKQLWDIGYARGLALVEELGDKLPHREADSASPAQ